MNKDILWWEEWSNTLINLKGKYYSDGVYIFIPKESSQLEQLWAIQNGLC